MTQDILAVVWKERRAIMRYRGSRLRLALMLLSPLWLAVYVPWDAGAGWVRGYPSLLVALLVPVILVGVTVPDSFAGERERHTLATLLASRLPDRAILYGKLGWSVGVAWGGTLLLLLVSLVVVNARAGGGGILVYRPAVLLPDVAGSLLMALLAGGVGVLISLRSATAQEAAQLLMAVFLVPPMLVTALLVALGSRVISVVRSVDTDLLVLGVLAALALAAAAALIVADRRFHRARLIVAR